MQITVHNQGQKGIQIRSIKKLAAMILSAIGPGSNAELSIVLTGNKGIHALNKQYMKKDRPTDVLSFPMYSSTLELMNAAGNCAPGIADCALVLGDVVISVEKAKQQAKENAVTVSEELTRLLIHGVLHLLGYDHEKGGSAAVRMRKEEARLWELAGDNGIV